MKENSPLELDEVLFTNRLLFETLNFDQPIEKTAEPWFRGLGLSNGAIENFLRVMWINKHTTVPEIYRGYVPPIVESSPWETQAAFFNRVSELQGWLKENRVEPCDVEIFVH
ncbi:hypothetical protein SAMN06265222_101657 [Neorhodopirellula lusitana]|uniref:Uncharacterized protein n=1 Tax=Neorhodopirellula lusitana TaxID=445327 RepID=A0ABY1PQ51_9BACT|nr:hypothetical protein [Neorhodopirellula lusitana]SMP41797.1 hypothetical protein SAMN06265222_101657 [Neorhodopirellula lusitana]